MFAHTHTLVPRLPVARELLREEQTKCRGYGQRHGSDLNKLDQVMIPVLFEQLGAPLQGHTPSFSDSWACCLLSSQH